MKGQTVGNEVALLWPSEADMWALRDITCQDYVTSELSALDLLWPASLINEQAQLKARRDWSNPLAVLSFLATALIAVALGPMQMILVAAILDYGWVTTTYYSAALNIAFVALGVVSLVNLIALALAWRAQPKRTYLTMTLVGGSIIEFGLIWFSGTTLHWQPHILTLILLLVLAGFFIVAIFVSKIYTTRNHNSTPIKVTLSILMALAVAEALLSVINFIDFSGTGDPERLRQLSIAQEQAHRPEITRTLSDLTYTLCGEPYSIIYASQDTPSGLFECQDSGEVFSVTDTRNHDKSVQGLALYLGTTKDRAISRIFPSSHYLYRALPDSSQEYELSIMVAATTERELVDNITQPLLDYWQDHSSHDLLVSIFYNNDFGSVTATRDFVLMSALDTMTMTSNLPRGSTLEGYWEGKIAPFIYEPDKNHTALDELGADPKNYADSSRIALLTHRHISIHLTAGETFDYDTLREKLQNSFTGGLESTNE